MAGETKKYRDQLRQQVDTATYDEITGLAQRILSALPATDRIGSLAAALQLAAISYSEFGVAAVRAMLEEAQRNQK